MITIRTRTGIHSGRSVETIVRRWYGKTAEVRWNSDPAVAELGRIVKPFDGRRFPGRADMQVLDMLLSVDTASA